MPKKNNSQFSILNSQLFDGVYTGKKVLVTGHTGFKGSWLTLWLLKLGASVVGISKDIPTTPSLYEILNLKSDIKDYRVDLRDLDKIVSIIEKEEPDFLFHLAAQPIVSVSYKNPIETITSNVLGTTNILEALRLSNHICTAIIITSDKAYDNVEWVWGYRENDRLGGKDIYSGSKGAAELVIKSYFHSFFSKKDSNIKLAIGRAGNVIGGGDFAKDRIVVDCMKAWSKGEKVAIRSPKATRPWQYVLEPLSGYLTLCGKLYKDNKLNGEAFNFGPQAEQNRTVLELLLDLSKIWDIKDSYDITDNIPFNEAGLLKLNCDKALFYLKWCANFDYNKTVKFTGEWYLNFYKNNINMKSFTIDQIDKYEYYAKNKGLQWTE